MKEKKITLILEDYEEIEIAYKELLEASLEDLDRITGGRRIKEIIGL